MKFDSTLATLFAAEATSVTTSQAGAAAVGQRVRIVDGQLRPA